MLIALTVSALVACTFVSPTRASDLGNSESQIHRTAGPAATALTFPQHQLRFEFVADSENQRTRRLVALGGELAEQRALVQRWKRTTVLSVVYLSLGPVLWILGAVAIDRWGPDPAFGSPLGVGVGFTIAGGIFLPLSIVLTRKSEERIKEIEVDIELDERGYEFGERKAPLRGPGILVPLLAVRF